MVGMWILAALIIALGFVLSWLDVLDRNWLARAGCLVVALGIWSGLGSILSDRVYVRTYELRRRVLVARTRMRYRHDPAKRDEAVKAVEQWLEERLERHRGEHKLSLGILEATLVIVGTLLWGFGDLLRFAF